MLEIGLSRNLQGFRTKPHSVFEHIPCKWATWITTLENEKKGTTNGTTTLGGSKNHDMDLRILSKI